MVAVTSTSAFSSLRVFLERIDGVHSSSVGFHVCKEGRGRRRLDGVNKSIIRVVAAYNGEAFAVCVMSGPLSFFFLYLVWVGDCSRMTSLSPPPSWTGRIFTFLHACCTAGSKQSTVC